VSKNPIPILPEELDILRHLKNDHNEEIVFNNRPVQPLNGRKIDIYLG
jgi:Eukaryotic-type carbonic anhydrase